MEQATFGKKRLLDVLARLEASPVDYLTVYANPSSFPHHAPNLAVEFSSFAQDIIEALSTEAVIQEALRYGTGAAIFWSGEENRLVVLPPFAIPEDKVYKGRPETSQLRQLLAKERMLGLMLVTWGSYAVAVLKGDRLTEYKAGTGYIHKRHRKGGRSEKRFARRTEEQKKDFLRRVANRIEERFKGYCPEQIFFGGNRLILKPLLEESPYLKAEVRRISKRFLHVRYADKEALLGSAEDVNKSLIFSY